MSSKIEKFQRSAKFLSADVGADEMALFNPQNAERYFGMNPTAKAIWSQLSVAMTRAELLNALKDEFNDNDNDNEIASDVDVFLQKLLDEEIIEAVD